MSKKLPTWANAVLAWMKEHNTGNQEEIQHMFETEPDHLMNIGAQIGFEAGRKYQRDNPDADPDPIKD